MVMRRSSSVILAIVSASTLVVAWIASSNPITTAPAPAASGSPTPAGTTTPAVDPTATPTPAAPVTVDGISVDTKYGAVQVQVTLLDQQIVDLVALALPDSSETSVEVSNRASPILREEVLAAQSASAALVSSATYTSEAYLTSVQSALDLAGFVG